MSGALPPLLLYVFKTLAKPNSFSMFFFSTFRVKLGTVGVGVG
jgi:hypothetical protein